MTYIHCDHLEPGPPPKSPVGPCGQVTVSDCSDTRLLSGLAFSRSCQWTLRLPGSPRLGASDIERIRALFLCNRYTDRVTIDLRDGSLGSALLPLTYAAGRPLRIYAQHLSLQLGNNQLTDELLSGIGQRLAVDAPHLCSLSLGLQKNTVTVGGLNACLELVLAHCLRLEHLSLDIACTIPPSVDSDWYRTLLRARQDATHPLMRAVVSVDAPSLPRELLRDAYVTFCVA